MIHWKITVTWNRNVVRKNYKNEISKQNLILKIVLINVKRENWEEILQENT